ncbi:MAG: hypothetical protein WAO83_23305, partial [Fuerstiella sp.]
PFAKGVSSYLKMFLFCESRGRQHGSGIAGSSAVTPGLRASASLGLRAHPVATGFLCEIPCLLAARSNGLCKVSRRRR